MDNSSQAEFWGGKAGNSWVRQQARLDSQMRPVLDGVLARAALRPGQQVLDVGCGTGQSALLAAEQVGETGHVLGADISPPMLDLAKSRSNGCSRLSFSCVDVAAHAFPPQRFDRVISRFGVMFFADPVAAFANIANAMKPGAQIVFASWGQIDRNPWFTLPARIAKKQIGATPKTDPDAPGPFAFRDITKVEGILRDAGLTDVKGQAEDLLLSMPGGAREIARLARGIGPAERALTHFECDAAAGDLLEQAIANAFSALPNEAVPAEINFFTATRS